MSSLLKMRLSGSIRGVPRTSDLMRGSRLRVTSAAEALARDHAAIRGGSASFALMVQAGTVAAADILRAFPERLAHGVALYVGTGNNGGDAYIVAAQLARAGVIVRVHATAPPRSEDAQHACAIASPYLVHGAPTGREVVAVDGVLGTGHRGSLRDGVAVACAMLALARERGAQLVALDLPSGLDASSGDIAAGSVAAHRTLSFGTIKRGQLIARSHVGVLQILDIGLRGAVALNDDAWRMADDAALERALPPIAWNAHKGTRGHLALVGGAEGMAGAIMLATRSALRSGCGLAKVWVDSSGVAAVQQAVPPAIAHEWPSDDVVRPPWAHALAIGPGLGRGRASLTLLLRALHENAERPVLLDADALTLCSMYDVNGTAATDTHDAAAMLRSVTLNASHCVITPHIGEFAALTGVATTLDWQMRSDVLRDFARRANVTVLLKGTPTLIATPDGGPVTVMARGNALLATGGSGDILTGIIGALLAQGLSSHDAAMLGATAHGLAAEFAVATSNTVRGLTLDAVLDALPTAWSSMASASALPPHVLASFPAPLQ